MVTALLIAVAALLGAAWYVGHCAWWPFAACRRCHGAGKFRSASGRSWRRCSRCKGSGERLRIGRRVWNRYRKLRKDGTR